MKIKITKQNLHFSATLRGLLAASLFAMVSGSSIAQNTQNGPIQVTASLMDVQPQNNSAIFSGNAEVIQNGAAIRSAKFVVFYNGAGDGKIQKVVSDSETFYASPTEKARGDRAVFDAANNTIIFTGNVILTQNRNVLTGDELRVNTITKQSVMKSNSGKVKGVFFPNDAPPSKPKK